jgi:acyl-CoA thioesterase
VSSKLNQSIRRNTLSLAQDSDHIEDNKTRQWLKTGSISSEVGERIHHSGLAFLSDQYILDTPARLQNLQLGLGEASVGTSQKDSPYNQRSTKQSPNITDFRTSPPSDFRVLTTLNHTIHFCDPGAVKADEWIFMEGSTTFGHGGRVLSHSKLFARDGRMLAVCTQEVYFPAPEYKSENLLYVRDTIG